LVDLNELRIDGQKVPVQASVVRSSPKGKVAEFDISNTGHSATMSHLPLEKVSRSLGSATIEVAYDVQIQELAGRALKHPIVVKGQHLAVTVKVVNHPTADYQTNLAPAKQAERAGVWLRRGNKVAPLQIVFGLRDQPFEWTHFNAWLRLDDGEVVRLDRVGRSHGSDKGHHRCSNQWGLSSVEAAEDQATADLVVRPDVERAETATSIPTLWLGQWVFEDVPLDAQPLRQHAGRTYDENMPSLVPAKAKRLTVKEVSVRRITSCSGGGGSRSCGMVLLQESCHGEQEAASEAEAAGVAAGA
jgi:hypothetical protein